jgi:hypothetical protein
MIARLLAGLITLLAAGGGVILLVPPAQAFIFPDVSCEIDGGRHGMGPEVYGGGATFWVPLVRNEDVRPAPGGSGRDDRPEEEGGDPRSGYQMRSSRHTLWEVVGPRGLTWSYEPESLDGVFDDETGTDPQENFEESCSPVNAATNAIAHLLWEGARFIGGMNIGLKQLATNEAPFSEMVGGLQRVLNSMQDYLLRPAIPVAVVLAGIWVMTRSHRGADQRETYAGVISSAAIVVAITALMFGNNYTNTVEAVDSGVSSFNNAMMEIISVGRVDDPNHPCFLPADATYNEGKRTSTCLLYDDLLYTPWVSGQFGGTYEDFVTDGDDRAADQGGLTYNNPDDPDERYNACTARPRDNATDRWRASYRCAWEDRTSIPNDDGDVPRINLPVQQVIAQAMTRNENLATTESTVGDEDRIDVEAHHGLWLGVKYEMARSYPQSYETWRGGEPVGRLSTAVAAMLVNLIAFVFIAVLSLLALFWHGVFLISFVFLPLVAAIAAFPPARRIVKTFVGIMVQAVFLRCVFGLILAVLLAVLNALQVTEGSLPLKLLLMLIAAAAMWKLLTALRSGAMAPQIVQESTQATGISDRMATGAAAAGGAAAGSAASGAVRRYRGTVAGARAGRQAGEHTAAELGFVRGSDEWKQTVQQGRREGAMEGYRSASRRGRDEHRAREAVDRTVEAREEAWRQRRRQQVADHRYGETIETIKDPKRPPKQDPPAFPLE